MPAYDTESLRDSAARLLTRSSSAVLLHAVVGFGVGLFLGACLVVGMNGLRRVHQLRSCDDWNELRHSEDKRAELASLFDRLPVGALGAGVFLGAVGAWAGRLRALRLRFDAQQALCLIELEKHARRGSD